MRWDFWIRLIRGFKKDGAVLGLVITFALLVLALGEWGSALAGAAVVVLFAWEWGED